jgi:soluble lytic murein transglycosylase
MSSHAARRRVARRPPRARIRRRRLAAVAVAVLLGAMCAAIITGLGPEAVRELGALPLRHDDIIRQQAADKDLDPALIAAVIYAESHFRNGQTSSAGAIGLMQVTPATARDIARRSGGTTFVTGDLHDPQVNISYGSYHLRYLIDHFGGNEAFAVAAYNAGEGNVDRWIAEARVQGRELSPAAIPFPETRAYVEKVRAAREQYRDSYAAELGLD